MKRVAAQLALLLVCSCLLPLVGYYALYAAKAQDVSAAASQLLQDAAFSGASENAAPATPPAPAQSEAAGEARSAPAAQSTSVLVQDSASGEVLAVPLREYVIGAVASEMPTTWPDAVLQAQAVAIHTYVLYCRDHNDTDSMGGAWLTADPARRQGFMTDAVLHSYWGTDYDANYNRLAALVDPVLDTVVTWQGEIAATSYFAISNGRTEASQNVWGAALPYLQGVDSSWDKDVEGYSSQVCFTHQQMYDALVSGLGLTPDGIAPADYFSGFTYTDAGYVSSVSVCGTSVQGTVLRSALHLRSACYSIAYADNQFTVTTLGYGHGVGLSQVGAKAMAEAGTGWQDILQHYFPGTTLKAAA